MLLFRLAVEVLMSNDFQWAECKCMHNFLHARIVSFAGHFISPLWVSLKGTIGFIYPHVHPNLGPTITQNHNLAIFHEQFRGKETLILMYFYQIVHVVLTLKMLKK